MIKITIICFILFSSSFSFAKEDQCLVCHQVLDDTPSKLYMNDVHFNKGITCAGCHGGNSDSDDMDIAMSKSSGFIGVPKGNTKTEVCIKCHSDESTMKSYGSKLSLKQFESLQSSVHGKLSTSGNERILQCTSCHLSHGIKSVNNPLSPMHSLNIPKTCSNCHSSAGYMRTYNPSLAVDQYQKYLTSKHGKLNAAGDSKTADCVDCHGGHDIKNSINPLSRVYKINLPFTCAECHSNENYMKSYHIPTNQFEKYSRSVHGIALLKRNVNGAPACNDCHGNHAATPPEVESISKVCGTCHSLNAELFAQSPHKKAFDESNHPECETCHGNHEIILATNKLLGGDKEAVCSDCHSSDNNEKGFAAAKIMRQLIDSLDNSILNAKTLIDEAEQKGMEVSDAAFRLRDAKQAKLEARTMVHSFNLKKYNETIEKKGLNLTGEIVLDAQEAIDEYYFRRIGLGISIAIMSFLAITLYLYIKQIEKKN